MTLPASGTLTFSQIQTEHGGSNPIGLDEYYRQGSIVPLNQSTGPVPTSGALAVSDFYSTEGFSGDYVAFNAGSSGGKFPKIGVKISANENYGTWNETSFAVDSNIQHVMMEISGTSLVGAPIVVSNRAPSNQATITDSVRGPVGSSLLGKTVNFRTSVGGTIASTHTINNATDGFNPISSNVASNVWYEGPQTIYSWNGNGLNGATGAYANDGTPLGSQVYYMDVT